MAAIHAVLERSRRAGHLGPAPAEDQLRHALAFADGTGVDAPDRAVDLGSGGGIPGLVLAALRWPAAHWSFIEVRRARATFLGEAVEELGLAARVDVVVARAEDVGRDPAYRGSYDLVVARSFGRPAVVAECAAPLLQVGGELVVSEPPARSEAPSTDRWPADGLRLLGLGAATPVTGPPSFVRVRQLTACPPRYPRRPSRPARTPLF